ncbi:MAG: hypothetical protein OEO83_04965 [Alphaproteobacteria bacterium]|nr:hypothetical protein [Alphaproteobacteria bacterium]
MWKFVLTIALTCLTVAGGAAAADRGGPGRGGGWQTADHRAWHRGEGRDWRGDQGRERRRGESRRPRRDRDGDWRQDRNRNQPPQSVQDNYRSPFARPPARDRRFDRAPRYNPDQGGRGRARDAYRRGKIVSLDRVMTVVQRRYGGRVLNVRLDDRRLVYHLRVLTRRGQVLRISVDARNARILSATGGRR